jgi:hypothetical protein
VASSLRDASSVEERRALFELLAQLLESEAGAVLAARLLGFDPALVVPQQPLAQAQAASEAAASAECEVETVLARPHRISWARLLKRVFSCDIT